MGAITFAFAAAEQLGAPAAYTEKASFQVADGKHWTVPTLAGGRLYVRNERDLFCFDLRR